MASIIDPGRDPASTKSVQTEIVGHPLLPAVALADPLSDGIVAVKLTGSDGILAMIGAGAKV